MAKRVCYSETEKERKKQMRNLFREKGSNNEKLKGRENEKEGKKEIYRKRKEKKRREKDKYFFKE